MYSFCYIFHCIFVLNCLFLCAIFIAAVFSYFRIGTYIFIIYTHYAFHAKLIQTLLNTFMPVINLENKEIDSFFFKERKKKKKQHCQKTIKNKIAEKNCIELT